MPFFHHGKAFMEKKAVVGMSGGVDSSVAAYLLKEQGYEVTGVTVRTWEEVEPPDDSERSDIFRARKIASYLGIEHRTVDLAEVFKQAVVDDFIREYLSGHTPNPCIRCNPAVKWRGMLRVADEIGADIVATGHYAKVDRLPNGRYAIKNSASAKKDQTYVLYRLTQEMLAKTTFPVGDYEKDEIRAIAKKAGLPCAETPDSQEICFFIGTDYAGFLERNASGNAFLPGNFVSADGTVLGQHKGLIHYTIGQRKGLGIAFGEPVFVTALRPETNEVVLGKSEDLMKTEFIVREAMFMGIGEDFTEGDFQGKIRYAKKAAPCRVTRTGEERLSVMFEEPQRAPTPGQSFVFYDGDYVAGGGFIE